MSLDFDLSSGYFGNMTHNVTNMRRSAGVYNALYMSDGLCAADVVAALRAGVIEMATHPTKYRAMNAPM